MVVLLTRTLVFMHCFLSHKFHVQADVLPYNIGIWFTDMFTRKWMRI